MARSRVTTRPGSATVYALLALVILLLVGLLAINAAWMTGARTQLDGGADAASLAGAAAFVDDAPLRGDGRAMLALAQEAASEAHRFAKLNFVVGQPLIVHANPKNDPDGDIVVGYVEQPRGAFVPADLSKAEDPLLPKINAVRVRGRRLKERGNPIPLIGGFPNPIRCRDGQSDCTAILDGAVIGFRQVFEELPIPLAPLALRSDPVDAQSWEHQVIGGDGKDEWTYDRGSRKLIRRADGLHEMAAKLPRAGDKKDKEDDKDKKDGKNALRGNTFLIALGDGSAADVERQLAAGVTPVDLKPYGGEFVLEPDGSLIVLGSRFAPADAEVRQAVRSGLIELQRTGEARAWPLFASGETDTRARVIGFVAARVAEVGDDGRGGITFELQPTRMSTPSAVTAIDRGRSPRPGGFVPYVVKLRLVD